MKTYSTKANAKRAAKTAGLETGTFNVLEIDSRWVLEVTQHTTGELNLFKEEAEQVAISVETAVGNNPNLLLPCPINAVKTSAVKNPVKTVWDIADKMWGERRKDIIAACVNAGIAYNTARTQYQAYYAIKSKEGK